MCAPSVGVVRLDGADVARWDKEGLGPHVGYLPQGVELFAGTIAENIARMGEPDPTEVVAAAQAAGLHELILRLPQGYDTPLLENGMGLSAGQRQRVALARALYGSPHFIVLDEPNANLDQAGDDALQEAIIGLKARGACIVIVAHRPSAIVNVDKLLVLAEGTVAAFGPREEILAKLQPERRRTTHQTSAGVLAGSSTNAA